VNFLRTVVSLCGGFRTYRAVRDVPLSSALKYLLKLIALLGSVLMLSFIPWVLERTDEFATWVDQNFPAFRIQDGQVVADVEQPYYSGDNNFRFILDTTGTVTNADPAAAYGMLVGATDITLWVSATNPPNAAVQSRHQPLRGFPDGAVNGAYFRKLIREFLWVGMPIAWVLLILLGLLTCLLQAYLFSAVASFAERSLPAPLTMTQLLSVALHAVTPAAIIFTVYKLLRIEGLNLWLIYLIGYGIFLIGGTNACRDLPKKEDSDPLV